MMSLHVCRWNSWYDLRCTSAMNESTVRATADALVVKGLAPKGFKYLLLTRNISLANPVLFSGADQGSGWSM